MPLFPPLNNFSGYKKCSGQTGHQNRSSATSVSEPVDNPVGFVMPYLLSLAQVVLLSALFLQYTASFPSGDSRNGENDEILIRWDSPPCRRCLFPRDSVDADEYAADDRGYRRSEVQTRQLGDLEFTSRHAELLKSKAKLSSLCSFLRRMQNSKKSGLAGDTEHVNTLMKQYMCASVYQ